MQKGSTSSSSSTTTTTTTTTKGIEDEYNYIRMWQNGDN
jgi:hypothetical protein